MGKGVLTASAMGAIVTEAALEAQEEAGAVLETLGLRNVGCRQAAGVSQAIQPATLHAQADVLT